ADSADANGVGGPGERERTRDTEATIAATAADRLCEDCARAIAGRRDRTAAAAAVDGDGRAAAGHISRNRLVVVAKRDGLSGAAAAAPPTHSHRNRLRK